MNKEDIKKRLDLCNDTTIDSMDDDDFFLEDSQSLRDIKNKRKKSFIDFLNREDTKDMRLWQALLVWSKIEYKDEFPTGEKPEIHNIYAGFDQEACEDTFYWE